MPTASTEAPQTAPGRAGGLLGPSLILAVPALLAAAAALADDPSRASPDDSEQVVRGARIYAEACASCHGAALEGEADWRSQRPDGTYPAPPHDAEGHTWHHSDRLLFRYIELGGAEALGDVPGFRSAMPGFGETLSDQEIRDVLAFIKSHWPEEMREYQRAVTTRDVE